jgi:hypothetical protein
VKRVWESTTHQNRFAAAENLHLGLQGHENGISAKPAPTGAKARFTFAFILKNG